MYNYMRLPRSLKNPYQTSYIRKDSYYWITIITHSLYLLYAFASLSQKPLLKFIN